MVWLARWNFEIAEPRGSDYSRISGLLADAIDSYQEAIVLRRVFHWRPGMASASSVLS